MHKWFIIILFLLPTITKAEQKAMDFRTVDSLSYSYYLKADWENLIRLGKEAIRQDIDYKRLRQRIGYAYFVTRNYYAAKSQYEKALAFDQYDTNSRAFLYYCGINLGDDDFARYHSAKLGDDTKLSLDIKPLRIIDAIDLEYNKKINNSDLRSNPIYARLGINSQIGYRLNLYQSVSRYSQAVVLNAPQFPGTTDPNWNAKTEQKEYLISTKWSLDSHSSVLLGFHYINTTINTTSFGAKLYFGGIETKQGRFKFGLSGSLLKNMMGSYKQYGLLAGVVLPSASNIYLTSSVKRLAEKGSNRTIFAQAIGANVYRNLWAESCITLGDIKNSNDNNGVYVYNFLDPNVLRESLSLFWEITPKITFIVNYTFDKKQYQDNNNNHYNQQSFLGGIRWKL